MMQRPMPPGSDPRLQRGQPQGQQQQQALEFGQQVVVMEDGQPVADGVIANVDRLQDGSLEYEVMIPSLGSSVTVKPDGRHQVVPSQGEPGPEMRPGMGQGGF